MQRLVLTFRVVAVLQPSYATWTSLLLKHSGISGWKRAGIDGSKPYRKKLTELGLVEHIGRNKYVLARNLYAVAGKSGVHTRVVGLDGETNKELLLKHIRANGDKGTPFKELQQVLPGHTNKIFFMVIHPFISV